MARRHGFPPTASKTRSTFPSGSGAALQGGAPMFSGMRPHSQILGPPSTPSTRPDRQLDIRTWRGPSGARILDTSLRCWELPSRIGLAPETGVLCLKAFQEGTIATIGTPERFMLRTVFQEWIHVDGNRLNLVPVPLADGRILLREAKGFSCSQPFDGGGELASADPFAETKSIVRRACERNGVFLWKESSYQPQTPFDSLYPSDRQLDVKSWRSSGNAKIPAKESTCWTVPEPVVGIPPAPGVLCLFPHKWETCVHVYREEGPRLRLVFDEIIHGWTNWLDLYPVIEPGGEIYLAEARGFSCRQMEMQLEEKELAGVPPPGSGDLLAACSQRSYHWSAGAYRLPPANKPARKPQHRH